MSYANQASSYFLVVT